MSSPEPVASEAVRVTRVRSGVAEETPDQVATEEPLEIRVRGRSVAVTMRTPGHDEELACGFLVTEGLLRSPRDVVEIAPCATAERGNVLNVFLKPDIEFDFERLTRHTFASSSCGLCGKATIESVHQQFPPIAQECRVAAQTLQALPTKMREAQRTFAHTGGLHAAGLFDLDGNLLVLREDVGRHNAVDKVVGWAFQARQLPLESSLLLVSGRTSFEIMQKALAARLAIVAAVSAPSSLAVEFARDSNQTLVGFLRDASFNVYTCPERVTLA